MTNENQEIKKPVTEQGAWNIVKSVFDYLRDILNAVFGAILSIIIFIFQTPIIILPAITHTTRKDIIYNREQIDKLKKIIETDLKDLDDIQKKVIIEQWIDQYNWTNNRATRERDANEMIRWWQIILGVLIPLLINLGDTEFLYLGISCQTVASAAGIYVAILTAIYQFRRPEERWRHYRIVSENYLQEFWAYFALSQDIYVPNSEAFKEIQPITHKAAFSHFIARLNKIKNSEVQNFFSQVAPATTTPSKEQTPAPKE
jgi:hypothetical protein